MGMGKRKAPERDIHRAVVDHLRRRAKRGVLWFHVHNNPKNAIQGAMLLSMGMLAGVSDILILYDGEFFALELKTPGGRPTIAQLEFQSRVRENHGHAIVAEGLDEAIGCLELWGLFR